MKSFCIKNSVWCFLRAENVQIGLIVEIILLVVNIGILIVIYRQFKKQGQQLKEQQRQFSLQSFQSGFFQMLDKIKHETEKFLITDLFYKLRTEFDKNSSIDADKIKEFYSHREDLDLEERRPIVSKILELIFINMDDGALGAKNAYYYSSLLASTLRSVEVREYFLLSVKEAIVHNNKTFYDIANKVHFFEILKKDSGINEQDKKIYLHINEIMNDLN